jgi:hypothetical protein
VHVPYDSRSPESLAALLEKMAAREAITSMPSEGGLFEYGSDEEIVAHLRAVADGTGAEAFVAGRVTREGEPARLARSTGRVPTYPRTMGRRSARSRYAPAGSTIE